MSRASNNVKLRAEIYKKIRLFFTKRNILEVETPLLYQSTATDPYIHSFICQYDKKSLYLQTSPESAMKRLLAEGIGSIYQICKAFRDDETGSRHNPEFTMLEWYHVGFDHHQLMEEMDDFLKTIINSNSADKISYQQLFENYFQINPHDCDANTLYQCAQQQALSLPPNLEKDDLLNLLLTHCIEPTLGDDQPVFIYDYPKSQAALAKIREGNPPVAERFEVYFKGVELANGYHELTDSQTQQQRFMVDNKKRQQLGLPTIPIDEPLLKALEKGLPECAGVALGIDRLIMLAANAKHIEEVL